MPTSETRKRKRHSCEEVLEAGYPNHSQAEEGERWTCTCGLTYEHVCDEAEGCRWTLFALAERQKS